MSAIRLATRYAKSIIGLAQEKGELENLYKDISDLKTDLDTSQPLQTFFKNPIINPSKKLKTVEALYKGKVSDLTYSFYEIIVKKRRELYLPEIADAVIEQYNQINGVLAAHVTTAVPMSPEMVEKIKKFVAAKAGNPKNINLEADVDESLIGGFILKYEDKLYDSSVASKLRELRKSFSEN